MIASFNVHKVLLTLLTNFKISIAMSTLALFLLLLASSQIALSTDLCKSSDWWYDIRSGKCRPCKVCGAKSFVMEPCSEFMDTLCVNLVDIGRSIEKNIQKGQDDSKRRIHLWHESEDEIQVDSSTSIPLANAAIARSVFQDFENQWGHIVFVVLCVTMFFIAGSVVLLLLKIVGRRRCGKLHTFLTLNFI